MSINIKHFRDLPLETLVKEAQGLGIDNAGNFRPSELIFELVCRKVDRGDGIVGSGILEILSDGFGFLRSPVSEYAPGTDDIYVSPAQIRRFNLRTGDWIVGKARIPRGDERYFALLRIDEVNGASPETEKKRLHFDSMSVDQRQGDVEVTDPEWTSTFRALNVQKGSRNLLIFERFQPSIEVLKQWATTLSDKSILALINVPIEDVVLLRKQWKGEVYASFRGEPAQRHQQVAQIAKYRAKRLIEQGQDVNLILSSLNEIALAERALSEQAGLQGGESLGIEQSQRFLSLGRNMKSSGSLTVWAGIHRARSKYEDALLERLIYEATNRLMCDPDAVGNVNLEASLQISDKL